MANCSNHCQHFTIGFYKNTAPTIFCIFDETSAVLLLYVTLLQELRLVVYGMRSSVILNRSLLGLVQLPKKLLKRWKIHIRRFPQSQSGNVFKGFTDKCACRNEKSCFVVVIVAIDLLSFCITNLVVGSVTVTSLTLGMKRYFQTEWKQ